MSKPVKRKNEFWKEYFKRLRIYNSDYEKSIRRAKRILSKWRNMKMSLVSVNWLCDNCGNKCNDITCKTCGRKLKRFREKLLRINQ